MAAKILILISIIAVITSACGASPLSCYQQSKGYVGEVNKIVERWDDANHIAQSTSRIALGSAVADLQSIKRDAGALKYPDCAKDTQDYMITYMDTTINGYLAFMSDSGDAIVSGFFDAASDSLHNFARTFAEISEP